MPTKAEDFFDTKRPWSKIKDRILGAYLVPYLTKLSTKPRKIVLIDGFAGPGLFEDGTEGSPIIMCRAIQNIAPNKARAILINADKNHHAALSDNLKSLNLLQYAELHMGDCNVLLPQIASTLGDKTVFLYLDPYGLNCNFATIDHFLNRKNSSTEIMIHLPTATIHRFAGREAIQKGTLDENTKVERHAKLTEVMGGDYWSPIMLEERMSTKVREDSLVKKYCDRLAQNGYLTFTGACPIQEKYSSGTKYHLVFASGHREAREILNDVMLKSFKDYMHETEVQNTLFADQKWQDWRSLDELKSIIVKFVEKYPKKTRQDIWDYILKDHFMRFLSSEYKAAAKELLRKGEIVSNTPRRSLSVLNDNCILELP